jgi:hypothetical protein
MKSNRLNIGVGWVPVQEQPSGFKLLLRFLYVQYYMVLKAKIAL